MRTKDYWIEMNQTGYFNCYRLRCPKCNHIFIMPRSWGVWNGCPVCWIRLKYRPGLKYKLVMKGENEI